MRLDKFISEGGRLTLSDIREKFRIPAKVAKDLIAGLYPNLNPLKLGGHTDQYPRLRYDGVHLSTGEELAKKADVCFLAITQIEFDTVVGLLKYKEELPASGQDLRRFVVGYRGNTISLVGQSMAKRAIRAYGAATALFPLAESCRFFFKVGGAAGRYERGTIAILCRGSDGVVVHDHYMGDVVKEGQNFPSPTAINFSHQPLEGLVVVCNSATCGSAEIREYKESPDDPYEWEFSGIKIAADSCLFGGELGMISVITDNYGFLGINS